MSNMNIMSAAVAAALSREPLSIEESIAVVAEHINFAVERRLTSIKFPAFHNPEAAIGALVALGYAVETNIVQTPVDSWIPVPEFVEVTVRW